VACITIGTMALVIVLSVFNGFNDVIRSHFNSFDPDIKIVAAQGKYFVPDSAKLTKLAKIKGIEAISQTVEENVLLKYSDKQYIATIKGVDDNFLLVNGLDTMVTDGEYKLKDSKQSLAVVGNGIAYFLQIGLKYLNPVQVYILKRDASYSMNPMTAVNHEYIFPSGFFGVEAETDSKYMIVPISFAHNLLEDSISINALEIKLNKEIDNDQTQSEIKKVMGPDFLVKNRLEQKELFYRIMKYEKWAIFLILGFILLIASFNVVGSLAVLIIEKKKDISILYSLGADKKTISRIFQFEGLMISVLGGIIGLILGLIICWVQQKFELLKLGGSGSFIIDAYPVSIRLSDVIAIFITVLAIGFSASWYTVKFIIKQYLSEEKHTY
jgi:lipoprotein-releasing system permease protein